MPPSLWEAMKAAPWIEITAPIEARTDYLMRAYADILADTTTLQSKLAPLKTFRGDALVSQWIGQSAAGDTRALTRSLMLDHYDRAYAKSMKAMSPTIIDRVEAEGLSPEQRDEYLSRLEAAVADAKAQLNK
mgnify:CR=1 FL=1